jgi:DNA-binding transcriptional MerR regulator
MKYDPKWLQEEAEQLGSWNKVCKKYNISPRTIDAYKKMGVISNVIIKNKIDDMDAVQEMYDSGMSIREISKKLNLPHSSFSKAIKTRSVSEAVKLKGSTITDSGRKRLSDSAKRRKCGGYKPHPNRGQRYNGVWFDSNWEVDVAKSLDKHLVEWQRPKTGFQWSDCGKRYYPDFYLPEYDIFLDPKNPFLMIQDEQKIKEAQRRNGIRVILLNKSELEWQTIHEKIKMLQ